MISVATAQKLILTNVVRNVPIRLALKNALGKFLSEEILSPLDLPPFNNSAMDGYALRAEDTQGASPENPMDFSLVGTASAGQPWEGTLTPFQAIRILTGASVPPSATAVVKQEDVIVKEGKVTLSEPVPMEKNIRLRGEELTKGTAVSSPLTPAGLALLASIGITEVPVFETPKVGILVTGSEIVSPGQALQAGQIYDSNSYSLLGALQELNISPSFHSRSADHKDALLEQLRLGFEEADFLIVTGGVSVGDFDFVREMGQKLGVEEIFWKVKQKPGKPLFFGKKSGKYLFGLPGNPASVLVCFYEYVRPALLHAMGTKQPFLPRFQLPVTEAIQNKTSRTQFLRGHLEQSPEEVQVSIEKQQGSHTMHSFARAQCLAILHPEQRLAAKEKIEIDLLPSSLWNPWGGAQ